MAASTTTRLVAVAVVVLTIASGVQSSARPRYRTRSNRIAQGLTFKKILDRRGPNRIRVLVVNPKTRFTLDVALGTDVLPGHERTSSMARRHDAVAAINGDFSLRPMDAGSGRPVNTFIEDGEDHTSPLIWGRNFSISRDETSSWIGHSGLKARLLQSTGERWRIGAVNPVQPQGEGYTMYTPSGGKTFLPPKNSCAARLIPASALRWRDARQNGVSKDLVVDAVICRKRRVGRQGHYVMTTPRGSYDAFAMQTSLTPGEVLTFSWSLNRPGVLDTIGGNPDLLQEGKVVLEPCSAYFCGRHPRTGVGIRRDGTILLVTVDGRRRSSVGMTLHEFARLFQWLGAQSALNLDGGGSTTMVVRNRVVNVPSDGMERPVGTALLVLPGRDSEEIEPAPSAQRGGSEQPPEVLEAPIQWRSLPQVDDSCLALDDPGSTGGMLDAMTKGLLGPVDRAPPAARWAVRVFRGHASCR